MAYFNTRELAAVSLSAALWAVINWLVSPVFWRLTHLPILCDMLGVSALILVAWWVRKPGVASFLGVLATVLNFVLRPDATHFVGFTVACVFFDVVLSALGYGTVIEGGMKSSIILVVISVVSTSIVGFIISSFFMNPNFLRVTFGSVYLFAAIHGAGGLIGAVLGVTIVRGLESRSIFPASTATLQPE